MRALLPGVVTAFCLAVGCASGGGVSPFSENLDPTEAPDGGVFGGSSGSSSGGAPTDAPSLPPTVTASVPPPPISGGTLLVTNDGTYAVAADPDRDAVYGVDLTTKTVKYVISLHPGDEPGRVIEDGSGLVHVALRGGGALLTINEKTGAIVARRSVCPAPRGLAWQWLDSLVWVACATGELVAFPTSGGPAVHRWVVERDLRDVIIDSGGLAVTTFRSAELLRIDSNGKVTQRLAPQAFDGTSTHVLWRALSTAGGYTLMVHQAESESIVQTQTQGGYGGGCAAVEFASTPPPPPPGDVDGGGFGPPPFPDAGGCQPPIVTAQYTVLDASGHTVFASEFGGVLPVDMALSHDGTRVAIAAPGNAYSLELSTYFTAAAPSAASTQPFFANVAGLGQLRDDENVSEQPIAVAFDANDDVVLQSREPASLWIESASGVRTQVIPLSTETRRDTGHDVFHTQAGALIACGSCHPEGGDDGHVWLLDGKERRTPSLRGTIAGTAPYHWPGDQPDLVALTNEVYTKRMSGLPLEKDQIAALSGWVEHIPAPPAPSWIDQAAAQRGKAIFERSDVGCTGCHSGPKLTDNRTLDVGTGGAFQVPPLVGVGWRTPLLHDGCAATIADRFGRCATGLHGSTTGLSAQAISDLSTYLETL